MSNVNCKCKGDEQRQNKNELAVLKPEKLPVWLIMLCTKIALLYSPLFVYDKAVIICLDI